MANAIVFPEIDQVLTPPPFVRARKKQNGGHVQSDEGGGMRGGCDEINIVGIRWATS